jgi:hypothetical protein
MSCPPVDEASGAVVPDDGGPTSAAACPDPAPTAPAGLPVGTAFRPAAAVTRPSPSSGSGLSRTAINFWLDATLLFSFLALLWVAFVVRFVFPPGPAAAGWKLWSWSYQQWAELQFGLLCGVALVVLVHVMLHWTWVCGVAAGWIARWRGRPKRPLDDGTRTLWGVGLIVLLVNLLGIALAAAALMIERPL